MSSYQDFQSYLVYLECESRNIKLEDVVLWNTTPDQNYDRQSEEMFGIRDRDPSSNTRTAQIKRAIANLVADGRIAEDFSIFDICCGDAYILDELGEIYPRSVRMGADINPIAITTPHGRDTLVYRIPLQEIVKVNAPVKVDISMMLNTYREWHSARLRKHEGMIPDLTDTWLMSNSRFSILTVAENNLAEFMRDYSTIDIGKGEKNSRMVLVDWGVLE